MDLQAYARTDIFFVNGSALEYTNNNFYNFLVVHRSLYIKKNIININHGNK